MRQIVVVFCALLLSLPAFAEEGKKDERTAGLWKKPKVSVGVNLHALWNMALDDATPGNAFAMEMARLEVKFKQGKFLDAKLQGDFDEMFGGSSAKAMMRDAWIRFRPTDWFWVKAGQLKRPYSRIQNRSMGKFETVWRGPSDAWLTKALRYGDRDLGVSLGYELDGKDGRGLTAAIGAFNGTGKNKSEDDANGAKDIVARVEGSPVKWLSLGGGTAVKFFDRAAYDLRPTSAWAATLDAQVETGGLLLIAEGMFGENWDPCLFVDDAHDTCTQLPYENGVVSTSYPASELVPKTWSAVLLAAYKFPIYEPYRLALQPVYKGEYIVPDVDRDDGWVMAQTAGVNIWLGEHVRLMLQWEMIEAADNAPAIWADSNRFMAQAAFDL